MASPNYDYDVEAADLQRRQRFFDAQQVSALAPIQLPQAGGIAGRTSPLEALARVLQSYIGAYGSGKLKEERGALAERYRKDLVEGMEKYYQTAEGQQVSAGLGPDGSPQMIQQPGDKRKAIYEALASNHPVLRELAMSQLKGSEGLTAKDLLPYATPDSIIASGGDMTKFKPKRDLKSLTPGEVLVDAGGNITQPGRAADGGQGWGTTTIGGDLYQQSATGLKKLDNAPKTNVSVSVNPVIRGEGKFMEGIGTEAAALVSKARDAKVTAQRTLQSLAKMEELDAAGVHGGVLTTPVVFMSGLADAAGMKIDKAKLANSQAYQGELMAQLSGQLTGSLARSTTDKDMEILKAPMAQLMNTSEGRAALRRQAAAKAKEQIEYAAQVEAKLNQRYPEAAGLFDVMSGSVDVPQRGDVGAGRIRTYNPKTGKIE